MKQDEQYSMFEAELQRVQQAGELFSLELEVFRELLGVLPGVAEGMFALISGREVGGLFYSESDARSQGHAEFGSTPFIVKQIARDYSTITQMESVGRLL